MTKFLRPEMTFSKNGTTQYISAGIFLLMVLAVFVKSMIPAGFMPDVQSGMIKMVICSGMGEKTIYVPTEDAPDHSQQPDQSNDHCAYQNFGTAKIDHAVSENRAYDFSLVSEKIIYAEQNIISAFYPHSLSLRGPPSFV
jgi:hypothetical protein